MVTYYGRGLPNDPTTLPFCGKTNSLTIPIYAVAAHFIFKSYCCCLNCGAIGPIHYGTNDGESMINGATHAWNDRKETEKVMVKINEKSN